MYLLVTNNAELSGNNRAGCKDGVCKKAAIKITKGELRFGTWVEIDTHGSWSWKHWQNSEVQEKVRRCVKQAHIDPEDFKGKNKPGEKGIRLSAKEKAALEKTDETKKRGRDSKAKGKKVKDEEEDEGEPPAKKTKAPAKKGKQIKAEDDEDDDAPITKANVGRGRKAKAVKEEEDNEVPAKKTKAAPKSAKSKQADQKEEEEYALSKKAKATTKTASKARKPKQVGEEEDNEDDAPPAKRARAAPKPRKSTQAAADEDDEDEAPSAKKTRAAPRLRRSTQAAEENDDEAEAPPAKGAQAARKTRKSTQATEEEDDDEEEAPPAKKAKTTPKAASKSAPKAKKPKAGEDEVEDKQEDEEEKPKPRRRGRPSKLPSIISKTHAAVMSNVNPDPGQDAPAFIPLEANPPLMTDLLHTLGVSPALGMHDVYSLTEPDLLAFIPRPALALLLVFPVSAAYESQRLSADSLVDEYAGHGAAEPVVWWRQTIRNACGMMGLLHAASNGPAREFIESGSTLDKLLEKSIPLDPAHRAKLLEQTPELAAAHRQTASQGATAAPDAQDDVDLHYVCFVKGSDGALYELDGRRKGPIRLGALSADEDVLSEKGLALGPLKFLERAGGDLRFSAVALAGGLD
ncbi:hypothetical protein MY4038_006738 [Beauveria bassiana]